MASTPAAMTLTSASFREGQPIPKKHAYRGEGNNVSPALSWTGAPAATRELALFCDDPDAPRKDPWVHWILYSLPGGTTRLGEGANGGAREGKNDFGDRGWGGPLPPPGHGTHHYRFTIFALDAPLSLAAGASRAEFEKAIAGHVLAQGNLTGTYERS
jgi:Raf kinase inhibitor-like YbhB/YbcL family protein